MSFEPAIRMPNVWVDVAEYFTLHQFEGQLTIADMERLEREGDKWHAKYSGKRVELVVIFPSNARMSMDERARLTRAIKRFEHNRIASSTVILAHGITGAMQRSILTGLQMLAPPPHPIKVFGNVRDALTFLTPYVGELSGARPNDDTLVADIEALGVAFKARS